MEVCNTLKLEYSEKYHYYLSSFVKRGKALEWDFKFKVDNLPVIYFEAWKVFGPPKVFTKQNLKISH